tara:strand:- start:8731 stop:9336 length:606 start_codon:yes stop_codon:yes gene_type:complete
MMDEIKYFTGDRDEDHDIMLDILRSIEFKSGTARRTMFKNLKANPGGSMLYGLTWKGYLSKTKSKTPSIYKGLYKTKVMDEYPDLEHIFKEYRDIYFPYFYYSQVQMNHNFQCPKHKDSTNVGESVLCAFGYYKGGDTVIDFDGAIKKYDCREDYLKFNGSKYKHWVEDWTLSDRYTLVFFDNYSNRTLEIRPTEKIPLLT